MADVLTYPSPTFGRLLLEYSPGEEEGWSGVTAREVVATYAIDGNPVPVDLVDRAKRELEEMAEIQIDPPVKEEIEGLIENLEYLSENAKAQARPNPVQATKLGKQVSRQRQGKARSAATGSARKKKVAKSVRGKKVSKALSRLANPEMPLSGRAGDAAYWEGYGYGVYSFKNNLWDLPGPNEAQIDSAAEYVADEMDYDPSHIPAIREGIIEAKRTIMIGEAPGFVSIQEPPGPYERSINPKKKKRKKKSKKK